MKHAFDLNAVGLTFLPLLAACRYGVGTASAALAAQTFTCSLVYIGFQWHQWLDEAAFRTIVVSGALPVILMATRVEQRIKAQTQLEQRELEFRSLAAHAEAVREDERSRLCTLIANDLRAGLD